MPIDLKAIRNRRATTVIAVEGPVLPAVPPAVVEAHESAVPNTRPAGIGTFTIVDAGNRMTMSGTVVPTVTEPAAR